MQIGDHQDALVKFDRAGKLFPTLWSSDEKAHKIYDEVRCGLLLGRGRESLQHGDLDSAEGKVKEGLAIRPEDRELGKLRDEILQKRADQQVAAAEQAFHKADLDEASRLLQQAIGLRPGDAAVQARLDQVEVERLRRRAAKDVAAEDYPSAVDGIVRAYAILEKPSNSSAPWSGPARAGLDELAKPLSGDLYDEARALVGKRQYAEAEKKIKLGLQLPSKDEKLSGLLKQIEKLAADPKTANLSGKWAWPAGECELVDNGTDTIGYKAVKLPPGIRACTGGWTRKGDKLEGRFRVVFDKLPQATDGTVGATIKDASTLAVFWNKLDWLSRPKNGPSTWRGYGELSWKKQTPASPSGPDSGVDDLLLDPKNGDTKPRNE